MRCFILYLKRQLFLHVNKPHRTGPSFAELWDIPALIIARRVPVH